MIDFITDISTLLAWNPNCETTFAEFLMFQGERMEEVCKIYNTKIPTLERNSEEPIPFHQAVE